ncbi:beta glucosidase 11 [Striga asiatica]|uniref:Beta glucosidase 11 n=1 Tax=Striga asiatica TaxID=4170 RepID=A0A5A7PWX4_STRAF|nr:beta glucosidase 11 [Striga asiatica]
MGATGGGMGQGAAPARFLGSGGPYQRAVGGGGQQLSPTASHTVAGLRCFGCGEVGHRQAVYPKNTATRALFTEEALDVVTGEGYGGPPVYDVEPGEVEEYVGRDVDTTLNL